MIRNVNKNDLETLIKIERICFPMAEACSYESMQQRIELFSSTFWVLEENGKILSFINGMLSNEKDLVDEMYDGTKLYDPNGDWLMIFGVDTLPEYQHNGYASQIMHHIIENLDCKGIVLTCKDYYITFYEQFGFVNEGISGSEHGNVVWYQMRYEKN